MNNGPALFLGILLSLAGSFWALLLAPQLQMGRQQLRALEGGGGEMYPAPRPGLALRGAEVYRSLGCAECHTRQVRQTGVIFDVRITDAGTNVPAVIAVLNSTEMEMADDNMASKYLAKVPATVGTNLDARSAQKLAAQYTAAGASASAVIIPLGPDIARGWGARLSVAQDYLRDHPVMLGGLRLGPDLANFGVRQTNAAVVHLHLYDSPALVKGSIMPPYRFLYEKRALAPGGARPVDAIELASSGTNSTAEVIVPGEDALALAAYLGSLKADVMLFEAPRAKPAPVSLPATNVTASAAPAK